MTSRTGAGRKQPAEAADMAEEEQRDADRRAGPLRSPSTGLKANAAVVLASVLLSVGATLLAIHFWFGSYIVPPAYQSDRDAAQALRQAVDRIDTARVAELGEKFDLIDKNRKDIDLIVSQIGQQIDGFWIPLTFDIDKIEDGEEFILPIDVRHDVEMMITASHVDPKFLENYLALNINKTPLSSINAYINIRTPRKLNASVFNAGQYGQNFELKFRSDLSDAERVQFLQDLATLKQTSHSDDAAGTISVLMVIRRPIFTTGTEENLPPPGGD